MLAWFECEDEFQSITDFNLKHSFLFSSSNVFQMYRIIYFQARCNTELNTVLAAQPN